MSLTSLVFASELFDALKHDPFELLKRMDDLDEDTYKAFIATHIHYFIEKTKSDFYHFEFDNGYCSWALKFMHVIFLFFTASNAEKMSKTLCYHGLDYIRSLCYYTPEPYVHDLCHDVLKTYFEVDDFHKLATSVFEASLSCATGIPFWYSKLATYAMKAFANESIDETLAIRVGCHAFNTESVDMTKEKERIAKILLAAKWQTMEERMIKLNYLFVPKLMHLFSFDDCFMAALHEDIAYVAKTNGEMPSATQTFCKILRNTDNTQWVMETDGLYKMLRALKVSRHGQKRVRVSGMLYRATKIFAAWVIIDDPNFTLEDSYWTEWKINELKEIAVDKSEQLTLAETRIALFRDAMIRVNE